MALLASPVRMQAPIQASSGVQGRSNGNTFMSTKHKRRSLEQAPKRPPTAAPVINKPKQQHTLRRSLFEVPSSPAIFEKASAQTNGVTAFEPARKGLQSTKSPRTTRTESAIASVSEALPYVNGQHNGEEGGGELFVKQRDSPLAASRNEHLVSIESPQRAKRRTEGKGRRRFSDIEAAERNPPPQPELQLQDDEYEFQPDIEGFDDGEIDFGPDLDIPIEAEPNVEVQDHGNLTGLQAHPLKSVSTISRAQSNSPQAKFSLPNLKRRSPLDNDVQKETSPPTKKQRQPMLPPVKPIARAANERGKAKVITDSGKTRQEKYQPILEPVPEPAPPLSPFRKTRPKRRGLQIVKDKTVAEVDGARYTRSGRTSVKPVEYWRGERVIYSEPRREGGRVSLPGIMDVVRIEDGSQKTKSTKPSKSGRSRRRQPSVESQDDPEEEWEIEPGVFIGEVPYWDPIEQRGDPQYSEQVGEYLPSSTRSLLKLADLALAPSGLAALTKEVQGASFQFAKHLTLPFFHSGMLDLPPGGEKTSRNSRQFHMVFWVSSGRVAVDISGNKFTLGRGGIWQVPRGLSFSTQSENVD